jgi:sterol desaturase/sphingolipid hydroxylase (fatty acid hydroxylase superfamily)
MLAKKMALGIGLALIFPMLIHYGVSSFYPAPKWSDYIVEGQLDPQATPEQKQQRQAEQKQKQELRKAAQKRFEQHLFVVAVPLGLAAILLGAFVSVQAIGTGLMFGGIFSICNGYFNYWSELADWMRFLSLLAAFIALLFVGYKKIERKEA